MDAAKTAPAATVVKDTNHFRTGQPRTTCAVSSLRRGVSPTVLTLSPSVGRLADKRGEVGEVGSVRNVEPLVAVTGRPAGPSGRRYASLAAVPGRSRRIKGTVVAWVDTPPESLGRESMPRTSPLQTARQKGSLRRTRKRNCLLTKRLQLRATGECGDAPLWNTAFGTSSPYTEPDLR